LRYYKFWKPSCYPCNTLSAILRRVFIPEDVEIVEIDASQEENKDLLLEYNIKKVPVLISEDKSRRMDGVKPLFKVEKFINGED
jgi:thiol-disulfide isomerase/thioredoxin